MGQKPTPPIWNSFALADEAEPGATPSKQDQIAAYIREAILAGSLKAGDRLPPSRRLADDLHVARQTVVLAYDRLQADGFLVTRPGAGVFVPDIVVGGPSPRAAQVGAPRTTVMPPPTLSNRGRMVAALPTRAYPSQSGLLAPVALPFDHFPHAIWARLTSRVWRHGARDYFGYADPAGLPALRKAIAGHLGVTRGLACNAEDIVITAGSQQAIDLTARLLLDDGDQAWVEDPGYVAGRSALLAAGAAIVPVPVDVEGLSVAAGERVAPNARMAMVTPSHQYPSGVTMSLSRRISLLQWAARANAWIVEDDYDGEFRYAGSPIRPLRALGVAEASLRVVYIGTFSKMLAPGLRIGFLVAPPGLATAFVNARTLADRQPPGMEQAVLADFITEGHLALHLRRMRTLFTERRTALLEALQRHTSEWLTDGQRQPEMGLHIAMQFHGAARHLRDTQIVAAAAQRGLTVTPISSHCLQHEEHGLVMGFGGTPVEQMDDAANQLAATIRQSLRLKGATS